MEQNEFVDSYHLIWVLEDEEGERHTEEHFNISLADFESIYGNNLHHVVSVEMKLTNQKAVVDNGKND